MIDGKALFDAAVYVLLFLPIVDWLAVAALSRFLRWYPHLQTARERRRVAAVIALLTTTFAVLALSRLGHIDLDDTAVGLVLVTVVAMLTLVNAVFLWQYRHSLFTRNKPPKVED